jgi:hypothetical protein
MAMWVVAAAVGERNVEELRECAVSDKEMQKL